MKSRFVKCLSYLKFSTRGRLARALLAGAFSGLYFKGLADIEGQEATRGLDKLEDIRMKKSNKNVALIRKHTNLLIHQAFRDSDFKGNIYIDIDPPEKQCPVNAGAFSFTDHKGENAASVKVISLPEEIEDYDTFCKDVYAMAGHEAVHILHKHTFRDVLAIACIGFSPILGVLLFDKMHNMLSKLAEIDADLTSVWKLDTAKERAECFSRLIEYKKSDKSQWMFHDKTHPSLEMRVSYFRYVSTFFKNEPAFFKSEMFANILKEREVFEKENDLSAKKLK